VIFQSNLKWSTLSVYCRRQFEQVMATVFAPTAFTWSIFRPKAAVADGVGRFDGDHTAATSAADGFFAVRVISLNDSGARILRMSRGSWMCPPRRWILQASWKVIVPVFIKETRLDLNAPGAHQFTQHSRDVDDLEVVGFGSRLGAR